MTYSKNDFKQIPAREATIASQLMVNTWGIGEEIYDVIAPVSVSLSERGVTITYSIDGEIVAYTYQNDALLFVLK
jgi:hypothetical protein